jgi:uncharacterized protein (DUF1501 family)
MTTTTRRGLLIGSSALLATAAGTRFGFAGIDRASTGYNQEILVVVFLRGGCDALNLIPPIAGVDRGYYGEARPNLQMPINGDNPALPLNGTLGLHPSASALYALYQQGRLAVVPAVGMHEDTRSHFDAMTYLELGTPGQKSIGTGWITRHLQSAPNLPAEIVVPILAVGSLQPTSLLGSWDSLVISSAGSFNLDTGPWRWRDAQRVALHDLYHGGSTSIHQAGLQALNALDIIEAGISGAYAPANGAVYPGGSFGDHLKLLAQIAKLELGLRLATVDLGGWDTHQSQGTGISGSFADLVSQLSRGLAALYTDLDGAGDQNYAERLTVVVMSEFGRRLRENNDLGTDHGHGGVMLVLGRHVIGGLAGEWPGLRNDQLYEGADLAVKTDYRRVLSEILIRRLGNPNLGYVFPGYEDYIPLGIVEGEDLEPVYTTSRKIFLPLILR